MEVERGLALKDLSDDLGHSSMATTDTVFVQTENRIGAESGKKRGVIYLGSMSSNLLVLSG